MDAAPVEGGGDAGDDAAELTVEKLEEMASAHENDRVGRRGREWIPGGEVAPKFERLEKRAETALTRVERVSD